MDNGVIIVFSSVLYILDISHGKVFLKTQSILVVITKQTVTKESKTPNMLGN